MYLLITDICAQKYISNSFGESYIFTYLLELQMKVREGFTITEKFPTRALSLLKAPASAFTFKTLL